MEVKIYDSCAVILTSGGMILYTFSILSGNFERGVLHSTVSRPFCAHSSVRID